ncbi:heterokaryon incompatibility protein Het-C-domain-containing protein [Infundibulicybe gibba]|nr:heterokaryon incompatibility protein Het-C-domain-containing protein [Infundibulicybe gibba]
MALLDGTAIFLLTFLLVLLPTQTQAFGAGDIPDFAYLNDKAFRHGDIENILENLVKSVGGAAVGGGLIGFATSVLKSATGGSKFSKSDIKKVYFGNWLRDYSQAMDIAGLSKLTADSLVLVVSVLGFMTFGFATEEFQVTADRLGVYLPVEHIDNPKGYAEKEGDARQFHPKLRPPVDARELEIDEQTGMKKYMATENQGWDTSTALVRRVFQSCIEYGRRARGGEGADLWEAYRLLGTGLHTMEDLLAHSNWCEIALRKMGHQEVFCHVGDRVEINTPNGRAPPLVTGTFGGADFLHSLMGEATDKLSQASVTDLSNKMSQASQGDNNNLSTLKNILGKLPIGGGNDKIEQGEEIHAQAKAYNFDPNNIAPPEVQKQLLDLLKWRDEVYRDVLAKIEMVPGLSDLIEELTNALNAYVFTVIAPWLTPILQQATGVLGEGSKAVIDSDDQYEVFNNPNASDPSHSMLSKDHFGLILNEPAGKIAQLVVEHSVTLIVQAWSDDSNPDDAINQILEAFHHPYYANGRSEIQRQMFDHMERWIGGLGPEVARETIQALTKDSVREGKNKRLGSEGESQMEPGYGGHSHGTSSSHNPSPQVGGYGRNQNSPQYGEQKNYRQGESNNPRPPRGDNDDTLSTNQSGNDRYRPSYETGRVSHGGDSTGGRGGYGSGDSNTYSSGRKTYQDENSSVYSGERTTHESDTYGGSPRTESHHGKGTQVHSRPTESDAYGGRTGDYEQPRIGSHRGGENQAQSRPAEFDTYDRGTASYGQPRTDSTYGGGYSSYPDTQTSRDNESYGSGYTAESRQDNYGSRHGPESQNTYDRNQETYGSRTTYGGSRQDERESDGYSRQSHQSKQSDRVEEKRWGKDSSDDESRRQYRSDERDSGGDFDKSSGYGSRHKRDSSDGSEKKHKKEHKHQGGGGYAPAYGSRDEESSGYSRDTYSGGNTYQSTGYVGGPAPTYSGGSAYEESGYAPSYGSGRQETFGAERLKLDDDEDSDNQSKKHRKKHGHGY